MFDLSEFETADTAFLHLKSPATEDPIFTGKDDKKEAVGITYHATGSPAYEDAKAARTNRALVRSKRNLPLTAAILAADQVQFLSDITLSFDNLGNKWAEGATGEDLFKATYANPKFGWVVDQFNAHMADWGNALKTSVGS